MTKARRNTSVLLTLAAGFLAGLWGCDHSEAPATQAAAGSYPFQNATLSMEARVDDLVHRMTREEKVSQMVQNAAAIPRLGIPAYHWWSEALHGVARNGIATVYPQAIGLAATWDTDLHHEIAGTIGDEARAKHQQAVRDKKTGQYTGLDLWSPNINIFRDPRWGRGQETYGEDPYLTGRFGVAFVKGLQGDDPKYFKTIATPKHFAVHSGPDSERHRFNAQVSTTDLWTTYLPAFEACIREGKAYSIMGAYSELDGTPCCANAWLLDTTLRQRWGFEGYVVSDVDAISDIWRTHQFADTPEAAAAAGVKAGCDLNGGGTYGALVNAFQLGLVSDAEIDRSVKRLMMARFKLGMFDPPEKVPYAQIPYDVNDSRAHEELSRRAAQESIVLLKNQGNLLPLAKTLKTLAVIGPNADSQSVLQGNYFGTPARPVTILQGIRNAVEPATRVVYSSGAPVVQEQTALEEVIPAGCFYTDDTRARAGLKADYFADTLMAGGSNITRVDSSINFDWSRVGPALGFPREDFTVRWTGILVAPETGSYELGATVDDGCRIYLDGKLILDDWAKSSRHTKAARVELKKDQAYALRVEYFQSKVDALMQLKWTPPVPGPHYAEALRVVQEADAVVLVLGITPDLEAEEKFTGIKGFPGGDRDSIDLPSTQQELLEAVMATGKPTVLVLTGGGAVGIHWAAEHAPAIVEAWYPGEQGGNAVADVLFGDYNPAGRLPVTFYKTIDDLPRFDDYSMKGRTYRYFQGQPLWPFGFGLSYTQFEYSDLTVPAAAVKTGENVPVQVKVRNAGKRAGEEVVQLYASRTGSPAAPVRSLVGFKRVELKPGEEKTVEFTLTPLQMAQVNEQGNRLVGAGKCNFKPAGNQRKV